MKKCTKCGTRIDDDRLVACPQCGTNFSEAALPLSSEQESYILSKLWRRLLKYLFGSFSIIGIISVVMIILAVVKAYRGGTLHFETMLIDRISQEFKEPRIRQTIQQVAENKAQELMLSNIEPEVEKFKNEIQSSLTGVQNKADRIEKVLSESQSTLEDIKSTSDFAFLLTKASNDDRPSFDSLLTISRSQGNRFKEISTQALLQIVSNLQMTGIFSYNIDLKKFYNIDSAKASLADFAEVLKRTMPIHQCSILKEIWEQKRFSKATKLDMLYKVISSTHSIRCLHQACRLMNEEAKLEKNILAYEEYIKWWEENRESYNDKQ